MFVPLSCLVLSCFVQFSPVSLSSLPVLNKQSYVPATCLYLPLLGALAYSIPLSATLRDCNSRGATPRIFSNFLGPQNLQCSPWLPPHSLRHLPLFRLQSLRNPPQCYPLCLHHPPWLHPLCLHHLPWLRPLCL